VGYPQNWQGRRQNRASQGGVRVDGRNSGGALCAGDDVGYGVRRGGFVNHARTPAEALAVTWTGTEEDRETQVSTHLTGLKSQPGRSSL